jgi:hypothetical protein
LVSKCQRWVHKEHTEISLLDVKVLDSIVVLDGVLPAADECKSIHKVALVAMM